ncbi:hypothetical protein CHGG_04484 [Chaetomium globosum CBS 148.51]|uniref:Uncharacterized protein n=1 Tax=Chaetomium globosum (strain ATCC 6205 / CBS 148.51 / DSM 1962 / NBRC 6347 / NRRL 1970) TaxID=306901 RepID=Q2H162_CHAGB|nr:uncharacterized protein CHGG_04484 [Chaetomium globosum CBS 148.51]EAQ87865.1 hypothetical protein CHGG_04484 [Chaetomium globosum CBS 148.51]
MSFDGYSPLAEASDDLSPLPLVLRQGLTAIAVLSCLSFVSSTVVLVYLTVKLARWYLRNRRQNRNAAAGPATPPVDLALGLAEGLYMGDVGKRGRPPAPKKARLNQFLILLYHLLLADIHQAASFILNAVWVGRDGIQVRTATCWAQAWLIQTGDLASSFFITAIAVHTYLAVVWNYTPPQSAIYIVVVFLWAFNYLLIIIGIAVTDNGREVGGFFVRATAWCWINVHYEGLRLYLHYLWIFLALAITSILYTLIFLSLRKKRLSHSNNNLTAGAAADSTTNINDGSADINTNATDSITAKPLPKLTLHALHPPNTTTTTTTTTKPPFNNHHTHGHPRQGGGGSSSGGGHDKAFLLYPLIYILCTAPLALGRIATMAGVDVPVWYFCTAGALITSNGWLDVLLWGVTRHRLLFGGDVDAEETGLDTFAFMRTPHGRRWGNMVWVEGGGSGKNGGGGSSGGGNGGEGKGEAGKLGGLAKRRMGWRPLGFGGGSGGGGQGESRGRGDGGGLSGAVTAGREDGLAIQMDMVTTVVVEPADTAGDDWNRGRGRHAPSGSTGTRSGDDI